MVCICLNSMGLPQGSWQLPQGLPSPIPALQLPMVVGAPVGAPALPDTVLCVMREKSGANYRHEAKGASHRKY